MRCAKSTKEFQYFTVHSFLISIDVVPIKQGSVTNEKMKSNESKGSMVLSLFCGC